MRQFWVLVRRGLDKSIRVEVSELSPPWKLWELPERGIEALYSVDAVDAESAVAQLLIERSNKQIFPKDCTANSIRVYP